MSEFDADPPDHPAFGDAPSARAFAALLPDLRRSARRLTRTNEDADDLVQETLLRVWARMALARQGGPEDAARAPIRDLRAYAFATLRSRAIPHFPSPDAALLDGPAAERAEETAAAPAEPPSAGVAVSEALAALDQLPEDQAKLLRLRAIDGLSYAEIARATGLPMGTVTSRLARGRAALRSALDLPADAPVTDLLARD